MGVFREWYADLKWTLHWRGVWVASTFAFK